jgi:hypothetical protein
VEAEGRGESARWEAGGESSCRVTAGACGGARRRGGHGAEMDSGAGGFRAWRLRLIRSGLSRRTRRCGCGGPGDPSTSGGAAMAALATPARAWARARQLRPPRRGRGCSAKFGFFLINDHIANVIVSSELS